MIDPIVKPIIVNEGAESIEEMQEETVHTEQSI